MPDLWMDVDVALSEVPVNILPLLDDTDFKTRETGVAYNAAGMDLVWNFVTTAGAFTQTAITPTTAGDYDWTHQGDGMYTIEIPASGGASVNNDTEGIAWITGLVTGVLPWRGPTIGFRASEINDALIDSDTLIDNKDNQLLYESAITTVTSQTEFIMTAGIAVDDAWNGHLCSLEDISTGEVYGSNAGTAIWISDVVASTNTLHINTAFPVTVVASDKIRIHTAQEATYALTAFDTATETNVNNKAATTQDRQQGFAQLLARKDAGIATDRASLLTEINADENSGAGAYDNTTDSLEATQDDLTTVKTKTDQLNFGATNAVDANLTNVAGGTDLTADGTGGQKYGET